MKYSETQALPKIAAYCSKAERAESEVCKKLLGWELDKESIERIITRLKKENFLNEERYCRSFIKDKIQFNKWGKVKIVFELKKKRIPESIINSCFEEIESSDFETPLMKILVNKAKSVKASTDYERWTKLVRFGMGRGYSLDQIQKCLSKILDTDGEDYFESFS